MVGFVLVLSLALSSSSSQVGSRAGLRPSISHSPLLCTAPGRNPIIEASIMPSRDIRTAKVYFRSDKYPKFYYIEMTPLKTGFHTALPKPSAETARIYYYIEAVDLSFNNMIGTEHIVEVSQSCLDPQPNIDPEIVVGASEAGLPALPPGFNTFGIVGTISAAGVSSAIGGGSGISSAVVVGAVAASAGGAVVAATILPEDPKPEAPASPSTPDSGTTPPTSPSPTPTPTPAPTPTPGPTPSPAPSPEPAETPEPSPEPPPPPPEPPSTPVTACFNASFPGNSCNMKLDAGCSAGPIQHFDWVLDASAALGGKTTGSGQTFNRSFPQCSGEIVTVTVTVDDGDGARDEVTMGVHLPTALRSADASEEVVLVSLLLPGPTLGVFHGDVTVNGRRLFRLDNASPVERLVPGRLGSNSIEAILVAPSTQEVTWVFDFSRARGYEPGSIQPQQGHVLSVNAQRIVFRLSGAPGERVHFEYRLAR